jgi:hypothetical protein
LVARHHGGPEATIPGARNLEIRNGPQVVVRCRR